MDAYYLYRKSCDKIRKRVLEGVDLNKLISKSGRGRVFIGICCQFNDIDKLRLAIELGADPNLINYNIYTYDRKTPEFETEPSFHVAVKMLFIDGIILLLEHGADIYLEDHRGRDALDIASIRYHYCKKHTCTCTDIQCDKCKSTKVLDILQNHDKKISTLFSMMLKKISIYAIKLDDQNMNKKQRT